MVQTLDDFRHPLKIERIDGIGLLMVIFVSKKGGIRNHNRPVLMTPERVIVRKVNTSKKFRCR